MFLGVWCECPRREWCLSEGPVAINWEILLQPLSCAMQPELSPQHPKWVAFEPSVPGLHSQEKKVPNMNPGGFVSLTFLSTK